MPVTRLEDDAAVDAAAAVGTGDFHQQRFSPRRNGTRFQTASRSGRPGLGVRSTLAAVETLAAAETDADFGIFTETAQTRLLGVVAAAPGRP